MAEPLEYFNPQATPDEVAEPAVPTSADRVRAAFGGRGEAVAVPAEFDARLELSAADAAKADVAATAAIEAALRHADLPVFRGRDASAAGDGIELHVRRADLKAARAVAAEVLARRRRLREMSGDLTAVQSGN